jgi:hypothetical protein
MFVSLKYSHYLSCLLLSFLRPLKPLLRGWGGWQLASLLVLAPHLQSDLPCILRAPVVDSLQGGEALLN